MTIHKFWSSQTTTRTTQSHATTNETAQCTNTLAKTPSQTLVRGRAVEFLLQVRARRVKCVLLARALATEFFLQARDQRVECAVEGGETE